MVGTNNNLTIISYLRAAMPNKAVLAILTAAILAGSSGVFVKYLHSPATSLSFIRSIVPVLIVGSMMLYRGLPFFKGNYRIMLVASVLNAARMVLFYTTFIYTSIGNAVLILFTWPIFTTIFSILFLGEKVTNRNKILLGLSFLGIVFVYANKPFSFEDRDFVGMTAALGTAFIYAMTVVIFKKESVSYTPIELIFYQNIAGIFIYFPFLLLNPWPSPSDWTIASAHATLLGVVAFFCFFYGLSRLKASTASLLAYIEIVSALLFGTLWLKEELTLNMIIGGAFIVGSTALLKRS